MKFKFTFLLFCALFILLISSSVCARSYTIDEGSTHIEVFTDGSAHVQEKYMYSFIGCYREVFRTWETDKHQILSTQNVVGRCTEECTFYNRQYEWAANFGEICDETVTVTYEYDIPYAVLDASDSAIFQYMVRGKEWGKSFGKYSATITFPSTVQSYYVNPFSFHSKLENNTITLADTSVGSWVEVRAVLDKSPYSQLFESPFSVSTLKFQQFINSFIVKAHYIIIGIFFLGNLLVLIFGYLSAIRAVDRNRRIPQMLFFRDFPQSKPYLVNYLFSRPYCHLNNDAVIGTLLDLVRRNYLSIEKVDGRFLARDSAEITFLKEPKDLNGFELDVYALFKRFAVNNKVSFAKLQKKPAFANKVSGLISKKNIELGFQFSKKSVYTVFGKYIIKTHALSIALLLIGFIFGAVTELLVLDSQIILYGLLFVFLLALSIVYFVFIQPKTILFNSKYEQEAAEVHAYKRFITDSTLLKKYPPKSVAIWDEHLVYAAALDCADEVEKQMEIQKVDRSNGRIGNVSTAVLARGIAQQVRSGGRSGRSGGGFGGSGGGGGGGAR